jgi:putative ABC transport system permease protein
MTGLALRSLRHRPSAVAVTFLAVLLGTTLMASFATLVESAFAAADVDQELLVIMGAVVGGWGTVIVLFSVASSVGITAEQRARETALLRTVGATPRQARALIVREAVAVCALAALPGSLVAGEGGRLLFDALRRGGLISSGSAYAGGPASLAAAAALVLLAATAAAWSAARRATRGPAALSLRQVSPPGPRRWSILLGGLLVASGLASAVVTITVTGPSNDPYAAMQSAGSASVVVGVGLALLAPVLLRRSATPLRPLLDRGGSGYLAAGNTTRRSPVLAGMLAPVIVFVATAVGVLLLVDIDERSRSAFGDPEGVADVINTINYVVTGMICLFAAIMVANAAVAVVRQRRAELTRLWRLGATWAQLRASVVIEAAVVALTGAALGLLAAATTVVPYAIARDEGPVPDGGLWLPPAVGATAAVLTIASTWLAMPSGTARG